MKNLILGTALWGWGVDKNTAFAMLDHFFANGGEMVDSATNYPINKNNDDYLLALKWISEWVSINGKIKTLVKIGSVDNSGSPLFDLSPPKIAYDIEKLQSYLNESLFCVSVHWDNRNLDDQYEVDCTIDELLSQAKKNTFQLGLSGLSFPITYLRLCNEVSDKIIIQVKENISTSDSREFYQKYLPNDKVDYYAYGINMGGMKKGVNSSSSIALRNIKNNHDILNKIDQFIESNAPIIQLADYNEFALLYTYLNKELNGVIIGPRNLDQITHSMVFWKKLEIHNNDIIKGNLHEKMIAIKM